MAQAKRDIEASWAGGEDGLEVLNDFLPQVNDLLSETGAFYLLLIEENLRVVRTLEEDFKVTFLVKRECPGERQMVLRIEKK